MPPWQPTLVVILVATYWCSALLKAVHLRLRTGQSSNPWPRNKRERALIALWVVNIALWLAIPAASLAAPEGHPNPYGSATAVLCQSTLPTFATQAAALSGATLAAAGLSLSWLAWWQMGDAWRLGTNKRDTTALVTTGVFGWVRHPIYASQAWLLLGSALIVPVPAMLALTVVHGVCLYAKAALEETFLIERHPQTYPAYCQAVGGFWPRLGAVWQRPSSP